jgi:hypothetical protein
MALSVLAYNLTRVMNIVGVKPLIAVTPPTIAPPKCGTFGVSS